MLNADIITEVFETLGFNWTWETMTSCVILVCFGEILKSLVNCCKYEYVLHKHSGFMILICTGYTNNMKKLVENVHNVIG